MKASIALLLGASVVLTIPQPAAAVMVTLPSVASGFIHDPGVSGVNASYEHGVTIQNYQAGYNKTTDEPTQNWFIFELPPLLPGEMIVGATLSLYVPIFPGDAGFGYGSADMSESFSVYGLSGVGAAAISAEKILDDGLFPMDGPFFDAWYPALVDGAELGGATVTKMDEGGDILIPFGPAGIMELEAGAGGDFLMGGAVTSIDHPIIDDIAEALFHHTHPYGIGGPSTPEPKLILDVILIPEPGTAVLLVPAFALLTLRRRRR